VLREQAEQHLVHEVGYPMRVVPFASEPLRQIGEFARSLLCQLLPGNRRSQSLRVAEGPLEQAPLLCEENVGERYGMDL
jgi:hypothetical protein